MNKIIQVSMGSTYDEVRHLLDDPEWEKMLCIDENDKFTKGKCNDCGHQSKYYAEHEKVIEVGGVPFIDCNDETKKRVAKGEHDWNGTIDGDEVCRQVRCPNCKSWYYWF